MRPEESVKDGMSSEVRRVFGLALRSEAPVLITGPTGAGKTYLARKIHEQSRRRSRPFVVVNLATLHEGTFESELFGHERGAFTGAESRRAGRLEMAQGGTVFLDEVGELSLRLQARLLEFLQSRIIVPVGGNRETRLDVRVIVATHVDLAAAVAEGRFREDLFHRLRVICVPIRSLLERADEFDSIVHQVLEDACAASGRSVLRISEEVATLFENYSWPGNLRELRNVIEYAVLASEGPEILSSDLPRWFIHPRKIGPTETSPVPGKVLAVAELPMTLDFYETQCRFERAYLEAALRKFRGNISETARQIGMNKATLIRRIRILKLNVETLWEQ